MMKLHMVDEKLFCEELLTVIYSLQPRSVKLSFERKCKKPKALAQWDTRTQAQGLTVKKMNKNYAINVASNKNSVYRARVTV